MDQKHYPDDLSDSEWRQIDLLIEKLKTSPLGRPLSHSKREMLNAIFYLTRTGCSWRHLPKDYPPWKSVYTQFLRWRNVGLFEKLTIFYRESYRKKQGRKATPSGAIIDSQSVKTSVKGG